MLCDVLTGVDLDEPLFWSIASAVGNSKLLFTAYDVSNGLEDGRASFVPRFDGPASLVAGVLKSLCGFLASSVACGGC